jgi:transcriptional regulator with XRE-family HTH domain
MRNDLLEARKSKGLTQQELAEQIGKSQADISKYERGSMAIDVSVAPRLAAALGMGVLEILYPSADTPKPAKRAA